MIRKFAIVVLLVAGVALSGSVLAQAAPQPAPKAMTATKTTTAKHHHVRKHHKHHHAKKHHKAHAKKAAMPATGGNTGK